MPMMKRQAGPKKKFDKTGKPMRKGFGRRRGFRSFRRKTCKFCGDKTKVIDYKDISALERFVTERGKVVPSRITGLCATHQRVLAAAIKKARHIALLAYSKKP